MSPVQARWLGWGAWGITIAVVGVTLALVPVTGHNTVEEPVFSAATVAMSTIGLMVVLRQPANRMAWLLLGVAFAGSLSSLGPQIGTYALRLSSLGSGVGKVGLAVRDIGVLGYMVGLSLLGLTAPQGRLPAGRWRKGVWAPAAAAVAWLTVGPPILVARVTDVEAAIETEAMFETGGISTEGWIGAGLALAGTLMLASMLVGALALLARLRAAVGDERQQLKLIVSGTGVGLALPFLVLVDASSPAGDLLQELAPGLTALAISAGFGLALFRYRLYDIDVVINRSLVYGALTAAVAGLYVSVVWSLGGAVGDRGGLRVSLVGAALVALVANPARLQLQGLVNRAMFGDRDDPYRVVRRLQNSIKRTLTPTEALQVAVDDIADALRLRFVAVDACAGGRIQRLASHGTAGGATTEVALRNHGVDIGRLVAARAPGETMTAADGAALHDVAGQVAAAVFSARLTDDLQRSRQRLVTAREEERRRLRRDLHDGLGPTLAAFTLQLDTARNLVRDDPGRAEELLERLRSQAGAAADEIRRVAYDLRPPALDELGLVGALCEQALRLGSSDSGGTHFEVEGADITETMPAAIEVAAYRIALEAMTNVARHARALRCCVRLSCNTCLEVDVIDDGRGLPITVSPGI